MKLLAANSKKDYSKTTGGALSSYQGRPMMKGVEGGISSDPGGSSSDTQA